MNPWRQFPLLRLILPVSLGIGAAILPEQVIRVPMVVPGILFLLLGVIIFSPGHILPYPLRWITGIIVFLLFIFISCRLTVNRKDILQKDYFGKYSSARKTFIGEIVEPPVQKRKSVKVIFRITAVRENGAWIRTSGLSLAYIAKDLKSLSLSYGDRLILHTLFTEPDGARNPGAFDNKQNLQLKGICRQAFVKQGEWLCIGHGTRNPIFQLALSWRGKMLSVLKENGLSGKEFAVAAALLLGYVDEIDQETMQDYSATGVMHILSVSGMHVGMIFLVLEKLLSFLSKRKYGPYIKAILVITFIWTYAMITGLSPAVMRAAAMLSLIVTGKTLKRHPDILNVLAASVIALLVWQPLLLMDLGFQLSYLAVAGIVLFYQPVYNLLVPGHWILDKVWSIVAVSIVAQLATLPLCFYYFHQFPNYFMFTNIVVIPLSNLIIYTGILALLLGTVPWLSVITAKALSIMVWLLNAFIHAVGSLPFSVSRGIVFSLTGCILLYLIIIASAVFFSGKKKAWLFISLSFMILLAGSYLADNLQRLSRQTITIYEVKRSNLTELSNVGKSILIGNLSALKDPFFSENLRKYRWNNKIREVLEFQEPLPLYQIKPFRHEDYFLKRGKFIGFCGKRILILNRKVPRMSMKKMKLDYLIITGNPKVTLKEVLHCFNVKQVVIDLSNSLWKAKEWIREARGLGVKCYSVGLSGAFQENIK
ncbi:MAG: ComEC/Rec2 family competence protein [Bacteroidetes bacterium]|nr:ComEC/Rec2 family competence protein [Bacteroidota bacterium]